MIIGHDSVRKTFQKLFTEQKLPHAIMLAGTAGIGKKLVAQELAQSLVCLQEEYSGCGSCPSCLTFRAGNYPDLHQLDCLQREDVNAESIRQIINLLTLRSFGGKSRILIFDNAEALSVVSSNILLKSLEEPRPNTFYILISANPSFIPITIRSRCQTYYLSDLSNSDIEKILHTRDLASKLAKGEAISSLLPYAAGSLQGIDKIVERYELWQTTKSFISDLLEKKSQIILEVLKPLTKEREDLINFLFFVELILREEMLKTSNIVEKRAQALLLHNILLARYYITQRNLHSFSLLSAIFLDSTRSLEPEDIERYIV